VLFAVLTTCKLLPYAKKEAAVKKVAAEVGCELESGLPNVFVKVI